MRLKITNMARPRQPEDIAVSADVTATVGQLAARMIGGNPAPRDVTLRVQYPGAPTSIVLDPLAALPESQLRPGSRVQATPIADVGPFEQRAYLVVAMCEDARGAQWPLVAGVNLVGRDREARVWLRSRTVSRKHANIVIAAGGAHIHDLGAANGINIDGDLVGSASLRNNSTIIVGEEVLRFRWMLQAQPVQPAQAVQPLQPAQAMFTDHVRPPRVETYSPRNSHSLPTPPDPPQPQNLPMLAVLAPVLMGAASFALTQSPYSLILVALSPLMMLGSWLDARVGGKREHKRRMAEYRTGLERLDSALTAEQDVEIAARNAEAPDPGAIAQAVVEHTDLLWARRPEHSTFLEVRIGVGRDLSRNTATLPERGKIPDTEWEELHKVRDRHAHVEPVPLLASLPESGGIGIVGTRAERDDATRALILQLAALHAPSELAIAAVAADAYAAAWQWLKWLPHVDAPQSPLAGAHLAHGETESGRLLARLEELIELRKRANASITPRSHLPRDHRVGDGHGAPVSVMPVTPALVVVILGDPGADPGRLVQLAERGPDLGIYTVWMQTSLAETPAACRTYVDVDAGDHGVIGYVRESGYLSIGSLDRLSTASADRLARELSAINDAGARTLDDSDLPSGVSLRDLTAYDLVGSPQGVIASWAATDSIVSRWKPGTERATGTIPAVVGMGVDGPLTLDLRDQGPHALVGGTTGSGKSEFLQTWIMSMAAAYSPERLTFLLVDYKGGSAFAECVELPHTVGLVTDLSPHLVQRALTSLRAELTHREHVLNERGAKDLIAMERRSDRKTPPVLVIVIDEFAALAADVPEFVDGIIDVAARGRSLGVHLVMATQRPSGVIKDNLRANTNLRVALRMADPGDSKDVIDTETAAHFDPGTPGRAAVRVGPGQIIGFQTAYIGAPVQMAASQPDITITDLPFGPGRQWPAPVIEIQKAKGPREIEIMLDHIRQADTQLGLGAPRRPWLDELPSVLDLQHLPDPVDAAGTSTGSPSDPDPAWGLGIQDEPARQRQRRWEYRPEKDGNLVIIGMAASGKSSALRTIAAAAVSGATVDCPVWVYGITSGSGLSALEALSSYGGTIKVDDVERVPRTVRWLVDLARKRTELFARANVANLTEYLASDAVAASTPQAERARILVLIDGFGQLREAWEYNRQFDFERALDDLLAFGPQAGVHVVVTADRERTIPSRYDGYFGGQLVLKVSEDDAAVAGAPKGFFDNAPVGRGFTDGLEVHIALPGAATTAAGAAEAFAALAAATASVPAAPTIRLLPERVPLEALDHLDAVGNPTIAMADDDFSAVGIPLGGLILVQGRAKTGTTTALRTIAAAIRRDRPTCSITWLQPDGVKTSMAEGVSAIRGEDAIVTYLEGRSAQPAGKREDTTNGGASSTVSVLDDAWTIPRASASPVEWTPNNAVDAGNLSNGDAESERRPASEDSHPPFGSEEIVIVERVTDSYGTKAEKPLEALIRLAQRGKVTVVVEVDPGFVGNSWDIQAALRGARTGVILKPDESDGYAIFRIDLPGEATAVFPPGRGYLVNAGAIRKVQLARVRG